MTHAFADTNPTTQSIQLETAVAYTDGACKGNPGVGGWGVYYVSPEGDAVEMCGGDQTTTNNRMELMAAIRAIDYTPQDQPLTLWTDSSYVKNGITQWIHNWKKNNWRTSGKKPVKNQDLWQQLDALCQHKTVTWQWVKGHAGHAGNEKADQLANQGIELLDTDQHEQLTAVILDTDIYNTIMTSGKKK